VNVSRIAASVGCVVLACGLISGCAASRGTVGDELNRKDIETIKKGSTSRSEVTALLGAPDRIIQANGREILQYFRYDVKSGGLFLLLVNFSRTEVRSDDLYVFLNKEGIVDEVVFGTRTNHLEFRFWPFSD